MYGLIQVSDIKWGPGVNHRMVTPARLKQLNALKEQWRHEQKDPERVTVKRLDKCREWDKVQSLIKQKLFPGCTIKYGQPYATISCADPGSLEERLSQPELDMLGRGAGYHNHKFFECEEL